MNSLASILPVSRKMLESQRREYETKIAESERQLRSLEKHYQRLSQRAFVGAQLNRLTEDFVTTWTGIDQDIRQGGKVLLARARHLAQNNPIARRFLQLYVTNVIGPKGHTFQPNASDRVIEEITDRKGKMQPKLVSRPDIVANMKIQDAWNEWIRPGNCSVEGRHSFADICKLAAVQKVRDGETFLRLVVDPRERHPLRLQVIPVEAIEYELTGRLRNGNVVIMGVELDPWRRPVAYYVREVRPELEIYGWTNYSNKFERIPANEIIHWYNREYYNQTRGVTVFAQVMLHLHELERYERAVVVNATASAAKMGFFSDRENEPEELLGDSQDADGNVVIEAEAGTFQYIGNKDFEPWDPKFPTQQYEMYVRSIIRRIASGLGVAYSSLSNDYGEANYSSLRAELLVERDNWMAEQQSFIDVVLRPLFAKWLEYEMLTGTIKLPFSKFEKFNNPVFIGPRWPWVDPTKDVLAKRLEVDSGFASPFDVIAEKGEGSLEQIYQDIEEALELAAQHGINVNFGGSLKQVQTAVEDDDEKPKRKPIPENDEEEDEEKRAFTLTVNGNGRH